MLLSLLAALVYRFRRRLPFDGVVGSTFMSSIVLALLVSGAVLVVAVVFFVTQFFL